MYMVPEHTSVKTEIDQFPALMNKKSYSRYLWKIAYLNFNYLSYFTDFSGI